MSKVKSKLMDGQGRLCESFSEAEQRDLMARAMAEYEVNLYTLREALEELTELRATKWYYDPQLLTEYDKMFNS